MYERGDGLAGRRVEEVASDSRDFPRQGLRVRVLPFEHFAVMQQAIQVILLALYK
jgi:hypothetical protein